MSVRRQDEAAVAAHHPVAVIGPRRSDMITGPAEWVVARHAASAVRKSSCNGMIRPLPFLALPSGNSRTVPMSRRISDHGPG